MKTIKKRVGRPTKVKVEEMMAINDMAYMFSIAHQTIRRWGKEGSIKKEGHGKYSVKSVFDYVLKRDCAGDLGNNSSTGITDEEMLMSKALYEKAKADVAECEVKIEKGQLILKKDIESYTINALTIFKREMLALSRTIPISIYGMNHEETVEYLQGSLQRIYDDIISTTEYSAFKSSIL